MVTVYGAGFAAEPDNVWASLTSVKQLEAAYAGAATTLFEFIPHILGLITNSSIQVPSIAHTQTTKDILRRVFTNKRILEKLFTFYMAGDGWGAAWFMSNTVLSWIVNDAQFRGQVASLFGVAFSTGTLTSIAAHTLTPAKMVLIVDSSLSVAKTVLGFSNTRFKTTFTIARREDPVPHRFGNIIGSVHDKVTGLPIEGVLVVLEGEVEDTLDPDLDDLTDGDGAFFFENITIGVKTLRASKVGYREETVDVDVRDQVTVTAPRIEMSGEVGTVHGTIINRIFRDHNRPDTGFQGDLDMLVRDLSGSLETYQRVVTDGEYTFKLPAPATYRLVVTHGDYLADSSQVSVQVDQTAEAADMLMVPRGTMTGTVMFDEDNDDDFEEEVTFTQLSARVSAVKQGGVCPNSQQRASHLTLRGRDTAGQIVDLTIGVAGVSGPGVYNLGGFREVACPGYSVALGVGLLSPLAPCTINPLVYWSDPDRGPCNCGISSPGTVIFDQFGTELTDVIEGTIFGDVAGSHTCVCVCIDTDSDGRVDTCDVDCAKARLRLDFRVLVGSSNL